MLLRYFYDKKLAQASYMIACPAIGDALIIDPARDIRPYLQAAEEEGLRIAHVTETHIHADFVSGSRELANATGARLYLSAMGGADWQYTYTTPKLQLLQDGDSWMVGAVRIEALHTPGHTPEHLSFLFTDTAAADHPMGIFTGDFLFVGDVGRPDLLEVAAGVVGTKEPGARQQYHSIQRIRKLPDYLQVLPGHGAGSVCGKALGAVPSTTLGYEKLFNPAFQQADEESFVNWLLADQPEAPRYFAQMKKVNKEGAELLANLESVPELPPPQLNELLQIGALVIDTRTPKDFAAGFVPGTLNIPSSESQFNTYAGWFIDFTQPLYLIAHPESLPQILLDLRAIGADNIAGWFAALPPGQEALPQIAPQTLHERLQKEGLLVVDVRGVGEYTEGHIEGVRHIPLGFLPQHLAELPTDAPIITQCAGGVRSQIAASLLRRSGFKQVVNLSGGIDAWKADGLPLA